MPTGTRVHDCVNKLKKEGKEEGSAIAICQSSTGQNFHTGEPLKSLQPVRKALIQHRVKCSRLVKGKGLCSCEDCH
jgi:hypothetical protein